MDIDQAIKELATKPSQHRREELHQVVLDHIAAELRIREKSNFPALKWLDEIDLISKSVPSHDTELIKRILSKSDLTTLLKLFHSPLHKGEESHWVYELLADEHSRRNSFDLSLFLFLVHRAFDRNDPSLLSKMNSWTMTSTHPHSRHCHTALALTQRASPAMAPGLADLLRYCMAGGLGLYMQDLKDARGELNWKQILIILFTQQGLRSELASGLHASLKGHPLRQRFIEDSAHITVELRNLTRGDLEALILSQWSVEDEKEGQIEIFETAI